MAFNLEYDLNEVLLPEWKRLGITPMVRAGFCAQRLREIAHDPHGFILRQGWVSLDFGDEAELKNLRRLFDTLQLEIVTTLDSLNALHESAEFELCQLCAKTPGLLEEVAAGQIEVIAAEIAQLQAQAGQLEAEIAELTGEEAAIG